jgi:hypothetical protein
VIDIKNYTKLPAIGFEQVFYQGNKYYCLIVKSTYEWDDEGKLSLTEDQPDLVVQDEYETEPQESSLRYVTDLVPFKPATDVLITGTARALNDKPVKEWVAGIVVASIKKGVRLVGPRHWQHKTLIGWTLSEPEPCSSVQLCWENAWGGKLADPKSEKDIFWKNPLGKGFHRKVALDKDKIYSAPQIEDYAYPITDIDSVQVPVGFGPLDNFFQDRSSIAGTFDENWQKKTAPSLPQDMDMEFYNVAPRDQIVKGYLSGGETVRLTGLTPMSPFEFTLPRHNMCAVVYYEPNGSDTLNMNLDTVAIDLDEQTVTMRWCSLVPFSDNPRAILITKLDAATQAANDISGVSA